MRKGKVLGLFLLACSLVLIVGILLAQVIPNRCYCWQACYYCDGITGQCRIYDGPGGCFCIENPCRLGAGFAVYTNNINFYKILRKDEGRSRYLTSFIKV